MVAIIIIMMINIILARRVVTDNNNIHNNNDRINSRPTSPGPPPERQRPVMADKNINIKVG